MPKLLRYLPRKDRLLALLSVSLAVTQVWLELKLPEYMSEITRLVKTAGTPGQILQTGLYMMLCALFALAASGVAAVCVSRIASDYGANLRRALFEQVRGFSAEEVNRFTVPGLITRSTNDVMQVQHLIVMGLQAMVKAPVTAGLALTKIAGSGGPWTPVTAAAVAVMVTVVGICTSLTLPKFKKLQVLTDNLNRVTRENLSNIRMVRAYNAEEYHREKFEAANGELTDTQLFTSRVMSVMSPSVGLVMNGLSLSIYLIGAAAIQSAADPAEKIGLFSDMVVFTNYAMQVVMSFMMLIFIFISLPRAAVSARRVSEVLETRPKVTDGDRTEPLPAAAGRVEFKNVAFRYPDAADFAVQGIDFEVESGQTVAIIGSTGCGKSTVVSLIPRFFDATEGEVRVGGRNVKEYSLHALRNMVAFVSQKAVIFGGTPASNVAFGESRVRDYGPEEIREALQTAQASELIERSPQGIDSFVAQYGANLSGGQQQRLTVARALFRKPDILIFDDSFSALDYRTDRNLRNALKRKFKHVTKIIVAQRIGTVRDADRILVMDEGRIVGSGTHEELMASCEVYRQIAESQLSGKEMA